MKNAELLAIGGAYVDLNSPDFPFDAGFIAVQSHGKSLLDSIKFACATAALKISSEILPTRQAVEDFLAKAK